MTEKEEKEDKTVRQFVRYCRTAFTYEKLNYYNERKHRAMRRLSSRFWRPSSLTGSCGKFL